VLATAEMLWSDEPARELEIDALSGDPYHPAGMRFDGDGSHVRGEPVRFAVIGVGYWGPNVVRNLHELPTASPEVVCDNRLEALVRVSKRYPAVRTVDAVDEVLLDPSIEAVAIVTPVATHAELARAALEAGKHVFVEKPLAGSIEEADELIRLADESGLVLMPGHTFLYSPPVNLIQDLIQGGELGDIYFVSSSRVNLGIHQSDVSIVWDLGPHDFSILRYWLGEIPERVSAVCRSCILPGIADVAFVSFEYASGTVAHVEMAWLAPSKLRRTTIVGSERMVVYDDTSAEPVRIFDAGVMPRDPETFGEYRLTYRTGSIVSPRVEATEPLSLELDDFCGAVRTGSVPRSSPEIGRDVIRMIEAVEEARDGLTVTMAAADDSSQGRG
jgi:predicted dehydrogenase